MQASSALSIDVTPVDAPALPAKGAPQRRTTPENGGQDLDVLTQLATRAVFLSRLRRSTAPEWCVEGLFVLLVDLNAFREINERFGYDLADQVLVEVGARLKRRLRPKDTVARFGPDEFAILLSGIHSGEDVTRIVERLQGEIALPLDLQGHDLRLSASVGVAMGMPGARAEDVIRDAERVLSRAQLLGAARSCAPSAPVDPREAPLEHLETALRRTLDQEEFRSRYRPTVLRREGRVPGFEIVLFRRHRPGASGAALPLRAKPSGA